MILAVSSVSASSSSSSSAPRLKDQPNIIEVPFNGKRIISREILEAFDADNTPEEIKYHLISIANGEESFIEVSGKRVQSFSQEEVNQQKVLFVHRTRDSRDYSSIQSTTSSLTETASSTLKPNRKNQVVRPKQPEVPGSSSSSSSSNSSKGSAEQSSRRDDEDETNMEESASMSSFTSRNSWNNQNVRIVLSVTDGSSPDFLEAVIEVSFFRVKLIAVHKTGISLIKFSHQVILQDNLTFETNDPPENMINGSSTSAEALIRFDVIKFPEEGILQKKLPDKWSNVTAYFTQRQINRGKVRYLHSPSKGSQRIPSSRTRDVLRLRASYGNIYAKDFDFVITFVPPVLRTVVNRELVFEDTIQDNTSSESDTTGINPSSSDNSNASDLNNKGIIIVSSKKHAAEEAVITSDHLTHDTIPSPCDPSRIIYTLLSLPSLGLLFLTNQSSLSTEDINFDKTNNASRHQNRNQEKKQLTIGSFFTQEMINEGRILYKRKSSSFSIKNKAGHVREDSFDFEVTELTEVGLTNVIVSTFR